MLRIRRFGADDEDELLRWFAETDAAGLRRFAGPEVAWPLATEQIRRWRLDPQVACFTGVAGDAEAAVGHAQLRSREGKESVHLACVAIAPERRGTGLGRALVRAVLHEASTGSASEITLSVYRDNVAAVRLYESLGFEPDASPGREGAVRMRRALG
jgi:[ribosomal protein S18]-alanine N-acetyltransferase